MATQPKRRPITDAEYRKLTPQQRVLLGLDDPVEGAPADFGGVVLPNPNHVRPLADTDSAIAPTRLPDGITFQHGNFRGPMGRDVSNPAAAQLIAPAMQTVGAKVSTPPQTLPADFAGFDQAKAPPATLPKDFAQWDAPKAAAAQKDDKEGLASALGSDLWNMLPHSASDAAKGVWGRLLSAGTMGVSDLPQFISSVKGRLDKGRSVKYALSAAEAEGLGANVHGMEGAAEKGDVEAVLGHALAVPTVMAAGYGLARGAPAIADAAAPALKRAVRPIADSATAVGDSLDPDLVGLVSPRAAHALRLARKVGTVATKIDAKINPETPAATAAAAAPQTPAVQPAPGATTPAAQPVTKPALTAAGFQEAKAMGRIPTAADSTPRTLSGESALRKVLTGQDNANLLKIAKSRGVNVTRESQLKPGSADNLLINKIVEDFKPEELDELSARYLEGSRFKHDFGDIGPEAWKTMSLQTYFPELKISQTAVARTHAAILRSAASRLEKTAPATKTTPAADAGDLTSILQESVKRAKTLKELQ